MTFELSEAFKNNYSITLASRGINSLLGSKLYTTIIMTVVVIIMIMIIFPCKEGTQAWVIGKLGLYIFISILILLSLHDGVVYVQNKQITNNDDNDDFVKTIGGNDDVAHYKDNLAVVPKFNYPTYKNSPKNSSDTYNNMSNESLFSHYGV